MSEASAALETLSPLTLSRALIASLRPEERDANETVTAIALARALDRLTDIRQQEAFWSQAPEGFVSTQSAAPVSVYLRSFVCGGRLLGAAVLWVEGEILDIYGNESWDAAELASIGKSYTDKSAPAPLAIDRVGTERLEWMASAGNDILLPAKDAQATQLSEVLASRLHRAHLDQVTPAARAPSPAAPRL